jgi:glycosyltransferase involved in cell wall biosynthesis
MMKMSSLERNPLFSVLMPTKNRAWLLRYAIQSVNMQTCDDYEIIVADNDDTDETSKVVKELDNGRIRYYRTGGLSMCDNWELAVSNAKGQYVFVMEDKTALKTTALQMLASVISVQKCDCISWTTDSLHKLRDGLFKVRIAQTSGRVYQVTSERVLESFLYGTNSIWSITFPNPARTAIRSDILTLVRNGPFKRVFFPVNPDCNLGYILLHHCNFITYLDWAPMFATTNRVGNGKSFRTKGAGYEEFVQSSAPNEGYFYEYVPIKAITLNNSLLNDYLRVMYTLGGRLQDYDIDLTIYFCRCYKDIAYAKNHGADMQQEEEAWHTAYQKLQPDQKEVIDTLIREGRREPTASIGSLRRQWDKLMERLNNAENVARKARSCDKITPGWARIRIPLKDPIDYLNWDRKLNLDQNFGSQRITRID